MCLERYIFCLSFSWWKGKGKVINDTNAPLHGFIFDLPLNLYVGPGKEKRNVYVLLVVVSLSLLL